MMKSIGPCVKSKRWNCWRTTGAFAVSGISASQGRYWFYCRGKQRFGQTPRDRFLSNKKAGAFVRGLGLDVIASHDLLADRIRRKWIFELYARPRFLRRSRKFGIAPDNALSDHCGGDFGFQQEVLEITISLEYNGVNDSQSYTLEKITLICYSCFGSQRRDAYERDPGSG